MDARGVAKKAALGAARSGAFHAALALAERVLRERPGSLPVLAYHRVDRPSSSALYPGLVSAEPEEFAVQMRHVARRYRVLSLSELLDVRRGKAALPSRSLLLTFDDAYRDFAVNAWPILRDLGLPAVLFVPTAFPDHPEKAFWWDRLHAALSCTELEEYETPLGRISLRTSAERLGAFRRLRLCLKRAPHHEAMRAVERFVADLGEVPLGKPVLTWTELRRLADEGVTLAPHTRTHPLLNRIPLAEAEREIAGSHADLEREVGPSPRVLAYPSGALSAPIASLTERLGFEVAFTIMRHGVNRLPHTDWLRLRRINVTRSLPLPILRTLLLPFASRVSTKNPDSGP